MCRTILLRLSVSQAIFTTPSCFDTYFAFLLCRMSGYNVVLLHAGDRQANLRALDGVLSNTDVVITATGEWAAGGTQWWAGFGWGRPTSNPWELLILLLLPHGFGKHWRTHPLMYPLHCTHSTVPIPLYLLHCYIICNNICRGQWRAGY